jgi:hypothetical protein
MSGTNAGAAKVLDKHALYELTVQSPRTLVSFLRTIHGAIPRVLGEDFAGTAALSRAWIAAVESGTAIAIDHDADVLTRAAEVPGLTCIRCDLRGEIPHDGEPLDILFVGNFSIGELQTRGELIAYLRRARERLARGGVFVCDTYGGESAFRVGAIERTHIAPDGALIRYTWEQREADATTARVVNALHFRVLRNGEVAQEFTDAFVYRWRLWSVPELRDALLEAGFASAEVHAELEPPEPHRPGAAPVFGGSFIVCVVGRT